MEHYKTSLNNYERIGITQSTFLYDHNRIKVAINNEKIPEKKPIFSEIK